ncbi:MAG TPA: TetR/AcrR family transcriptional regulator [Solirubrobacterales bacterium]|jgi:AcrR family transcriptional regulator|nr:TetR/AcrR family transcriptional regulator [Solirubrobacterales bacterium]
MVEDADRRAAPGRPDARERILEAMLDLSADQGYELVSVDAILERAGVTQADFDANFASLEDCALQLVDDFLPPIAERIQAAYSAEERWPDSLRAASYVLADWIAEHPREARFGVVEMLKVSELARARREAVFMTCVYMIDAGRDRCEDPAGAPDLAGERAIGSLAEMLTKTLRQGPAEPRKFVPQLMYLAVLPYLGPESAREELSIPPPPEAEEGGG